MPSTYFVFGIYLSILSSDKIIAESSGITSYSLALPMVRGYTTLAPFITLSLLLIVRMILHATAMLQASVKNTERVKATIVSI